MITKLAWKNIWFKPLNTALSILLLTAGVAIISLLILLQEQFEQKFSSNIDGVDVVLGAQGSPLQLILSSVYQVDAPTGNINYAEAKKWMKHPFVETAIPLAFGDNFRGFKIVGTTPDYLTKFNGIITSGKIFEKNLEVVIGSEVAQKLNLKIGDKFHGSHGDSEEGEVHDQHEYVISGIIAPTGKVVDNLILSNIETVWQIHESHDHHHEEDSENPAHGEEGHVHVEGDEHDHHHDETDENPAHGEEGHVHLEGDEHEHHHHHHDEHQHTDNLHQQENREITAVLIKFRNKMGFVTWPRIVAQNTKMQAASPAVEINRLFSLMGIGLQAMQYLAYGIMFISGISIFIALYNTLKERKYEFALLRVSGAGRLQLLNLVLIESLLLVLIGFILGTIVGRLALILISNSTDDQFKMSFSPWQMVWQKEGILFAFTILIGLLAALIPAIKAYRLNISKTLANA